MLLELKTWIASTKAEREAVLQQLERLLENPYFHKSKRFADFSELQQIPVAEPSRRRVSLRLYVALLAVLSIGAVSVWRVSHQAPIDEFWGPFFKSPDPVVFCVADQSQYSTIVLRDAADPK